VDPNEQPQEHDRRINFTSLLFSGIPDTQPFRNPPQQRFLAQPQAQSVDIGSISDTLNRLLLLQEGLQREVESLKNDRGPQQEGVEESVPITVTKFVDANLASDSQHHMIVQSIIRAVPQSAEMMFKNDATLQEIKVNEQVMAPILDNRNAYPHFHFNMIELDQRSTYESESVIYSGRLLEFALRRISELECPLPTDAAIAMNLCFQKFLTRAAFLHVRSQHDWEVAKKFDELTLSTLPLGQYFKA
jgi:hypothetical protein